MDAFTGAASFLPRVRGGFTCVVKLFSAAK
jgi:hypothetical protein